MAANFFPLSAYQQFNSCLKINVMDGFYFKI